jgi:uncharacterized protein (TIGR00106 family)
MIADFRIIPIGKGTHLTPQVAEVLKLVEASKLNYAINDMTTTVEGDWDSVMKLMKQCYQKVLEGADRVTLSITIDERKDKVVHLGDKVKAVEQTLGRTLKK